MNVKMLLPLCFAALFFGCKNSETNLESPTPTLSGVCLSGTFSKYLVKTVKTVSYPGTGFLPSVFTTQYFFDAQGRVDSIRTDYQANKVVYAPDGKVDKLLSYGYDIQKLNSIQQYFYENGRVSKTEQTSFDQNGNPQAWVSRYFYEWDTAGFVAKTWFDGGDDKAVFTRDDCGNVLKTQRIYDQNGEEHMLVVAEYADTPSPYFLIGLDKIFPGDYSVHNPTVEEIVHWDCGDYIAGPMNTEYEYDAENLPVKALSSFQVVEFFYQ